MVMYESEEKRVNVQHSANYELILNHTEQELGTIPDARMPRVTKIDKVLALMELMFYWRNKQVRKIRFHKCHTRESKWGDTIEHMGLSVLD